MPQKSHGDFYFTMAFFNKLIISGLDFCLDALTDVV